MLRLLHILRKLFRFPLLDLLILILSISYSLFKPFGAFEQRRMIIDGVQTEAEVTRITETFFGTFVDFTYNSVGGEKVVGTVDELDISKYGLTNVIPQKVLITYLPDNLDFVWLGDSGGQLDTFWTDFFEQRWMDILFNYALWMIMLRVIISAVKKDLNNELQKT